MVCRKKKVLNELKSDNEQPEPQQTEEQEQSDVYHINIFRITETPQQQSHKGRVTTKDFNSQIVINNSLATVLADTGASISVCGREQARKWNLLSRMVPTNTKIKPYNSLTIPVIGIAKCAVMFGSTSIPVSWHIIDNPCEPVLAGKSAVQLGIIKFDPQPEVYQPVRMIQSGNKEALQAILQKFPQNFTRLGKLNNHQVKLHVDPTVKPVASPARPVPYHLRARVAKEIDKMVAQDVIEEHPPTEPAPWVSTAVIAPKSDGSIRMTLDARNVNKAIHASNVPIPRQEDIKAKLSGARVFSKMDFKSAF